MAVNYKNTFFDYQNTLDSVPSSEAKTGTIATTGVLVTGTGTKFLTEMPVGSWVVSASAGEVRKVVAVTSDTSAEMSNGFSVDIAGGSALNIITRVRAEVKEIGIVNVGGADTTIDGKTFKAGSFVTWSKSHRHDSSKQDQIDPIVLDGATSACNVTIIKN